MKVQSRFLSGVAIAISTIVLASGSASAMVTDSSYTVQNLTATELANDGTDVVVQLQWDTMSSPLDTGDRAAGVRVQRCLFSECTLNIYTRLSTWRWTAAPGTLLAGDSFSSSCPTSSVNCSFRVQPYYFKSYCKVWGHALDSYSEEVDTSHYEWVDGVYTWVESYKSVQHSAGYRTFCTRWGNRLVMGPWSAPVAVGP